MNRHIMLALCGILVLVGGGRAEVKSVEMKIAGYLCGM